ncbi:MAG: hypothetical protein ACLQU1_09300 [Bryobacteraceae bacterium]
MTARSAALFILQLLIPVLSCAQISNVVVTNAASYEVGLPAPGSIGAIFCTGLSVSGIDSAPGIPLPLNLAGVTVTVGGVSAPIFAVADLGGYQQINFQVPYGVQFDTEAGGTVTANVVVSQNGTQGTSASTLLAPEVGAFFGFGSTQYGLFQHGLDFSLVTASNPARVGEVVVGYATGLAPPNPTVPAGQAAPLSPLYPVPQSAAFMTVGAEVHGVYLLDSTGYEPIALPGGGLQFMGLAPGMVGVYQINFVVPNVASGTVAVGLQDELCVAQPFHMSCIGPGTTSFTYSPTVLIPVQ